MKTAAHVLLVMLLSVFSLAQLPNAQTVIQNDTGTELHGWISVCGTGTPDTRCSSLGSTAPEGGGYGWEIPGVDPKTYKTAVIAANFGPEITCSLRYNPATTSLFTIHFFQKSQHVFGCTIE
jgi:hypothetical protein